MIRLIGTRWKFSNECSRGVLIRRYFPWGMLYIAKMYKMNVFARCAHKIKLAGLLCPTCFILLTHHATTFHFENLGYNFYCVYTVCVKVSHDKPKVFRDRK